MRKNAIRRLVRSTLHGGPAFDRDDIGTSYAAPKVTRIAARLQAVFPEESCLLYRALIVQSARWPDWASELTPEQQTALIARIGYGVPDIERATTQFRLSHYTDYRRRAGNQAGRVPRLPGADSRGHPPRR